MFSESVFIKLLLGLSTYDFQHTLFVFLSMILVIKCLQWIVKRYEELKSLPPGPWGFPIVGYLTFMGNEKHTSFMELASRYGTLFSARLGFQLNVVISDYKLIRECLRREEFTGRPDTPFMQTLNGYGIVNSAGRLWKNQRRFLHEKLRHLGVTYMGNGKQIMEKKIMAEVHSFINNLDFTEGRPTDLAPAIAVAVSNVICGITMGLHFSIDDPRFLRFNFLIEEGMRLFGQIHTIDYIPTAKYLPGILNVRNKIAKNREEMQSFYRDVIHDHKKTYDPNNIRDLIDLYIAEIEKAKQEGRYEEMFDGRDSEEQMVQVIIDLFSAGMETIKTTLLWINVFMLHNPEEMRRVQEELDQVIGRHRLPSIEDLQYLPVTESTILESMRRANIVPLATTHSPTRDVIIQGYKIPAGSHIIPLINAVHMDPKLWHKPEEFNPRRFVDSEGKVHKPEYFIPFGVGRRMCLGDVLARMELFLFFSSFMHCFNISMPEGQPLPSLKGNVGATITPDSFRVCLTRRPLTPATPEPLHKRNVGSH